MTAPTSNAHLLPAHRNRLWGAFFASLFAASLAWSLSWARAYVVNDDLPNFCDQVRRSSFPPEVACVSADGTVVGENVWWLDFLFIAAVVMTVVFAVLATLKSVVGGVTARHGPQSGSMRTALAEQVAEEAPASGDGPRRPPWVSGLVNLLVGVPAIVPLYCAQWLLTKYLPMDCRDAGDIAVATNCDYHTLDHGGPVMVALALSGAFVLALMVLVNGALPLALGRPLRTWLGSAALIVVPYAALWGLYLSGLR
ncbi:hypothetical protein ABZ611_00260 [Streptomyces sp. NPDC007861]|uniref:hypothetical protein n=1 Tax=Streptomyces sp. NPDC007861 TaxID=3154893 RepID=UPI0033D86E98